MHTAHDPFLDLPAIRAPDTHELDAGDPRHGAWCRYTAASGDSLWGIAQKFNAHTRPDWLGELFAANPGKTTMVDPIARRSVWRGGTVKAGDVVRIPDAWATPAPVSAGDMPRSSTVQQRDRAVDIARTFGASARPCSLEPEAGAPIGIGPATALEQLLQQLDRRFPFRGKGPLDGITTGVLRITEDCSLNGALRNGPDFEALKHAVVADGRAGSIDLIADRSQTRYLAITARASQVANTTTWDLGTLDQAPPDDETGDVVDRTGFEEAGYPVRASVVALRTLEDQLDAAWPGRTRINGGNISDAASEGDRCLLDVPESAASLGPRLAQLRAAVNADGRVVETELVTPSFWGSPRVKVPTLRIWTADRGTDASPWNLTAPPTEEGWEDYGRRSLVLSPDARAGRGEAGSLPSDAASADPFVEIEAVAGCCRGRSPDPRHARPRDAPDRDR